MLCEVNDKNALHLNGKIVQFRTDFELCPTNIPKERALFSALSGTLSKHSKISDFFSCFFRKVIHTEK